MYKVSDTDNRYNHYTALTLLCCLVPCYLEITLSRLKEGEDIQTVLGSSTQVSNLESTRIDKIRAYHDQNDAKDSTKARSPNDRAASYSTTKSATHAAPARLAGRKRVARTPRYGLQLMAKLEEKVHIQLAEEEVEICWQI